MEMPQPDIVDIAEVVETQEKSWFGLFTFLLCCLVMLVDGYDNQAINYAAPLIVKDWAINRELMTPVFTFSVLGWMLGSIGFSMIGDRIGRRNSILFAAIEQSHLRFGISRFQARNVYAQQTDRAARP